MIPALALERLEISDIGVCWKPCSAINSNAACKIASRLSLFCIWSSSCIEPSLLARNFQQFHSWQLSPVTIGVTTRVDHKTGRRAIRMRISCFLINRSNDHSIYIINTSRLQGAIYDNLYATFSPTAVYMIDDPLLKHVFRETIDRIDRKHWLCQICTMDSVCRQLLVQAGRVYPE